MAQIILTVQDAVLQRVLDGFAASGGYDPNSGLTKAQFLKQSLVKYVMTFVKASESNTAATTARVNAEASVDSSIIIS